MKFEIKSWHTGGVLFTAECDSMKACLLLAIKSRADLSGADLSGADLSGADLSGANLSRANLSGAYLSGIKNAALSLAQTRIVPQAGSFVGWKKLREGVVAELVIPHDAARCNAAGSRKVRAARVHVRNMWDKNGKEIAGPISGLHNRNTLYEVGKETFADSFDDRITQECSHGIHFFITKEEAEAWDA